MGTRSKGPRESAGYDYKEHPKGESKLARRIRRNRRGYRHALGKLWAEKRVARRGKPKKRGILYRIGKRRVDLSGMEG